MASMLDSISSPFFASTLSAFRLATAVMIVTLFLATFVASFASVPTAAVAAATAAACNSKHYRLSQRQVKITHTAGLLTDMFIYAKKLFITIL